MKKNEHASNIQTFKKVVRLIWQVDQKYLLVLTCTAIIISLIPVISLKVMQGIINLIQTHIADLKSILLLIGIYILLDLVLIIVQSMLSYYKEKFTFHFNLELKRKLLEKASLLGLEDFENSETYNILQRAEQQTDGGVISYFDTVISAIGALITGISYILIVLSFKIWVVPLLVVIPIIRFLINNQINKEEFAMVKERTDDERKAWYNSYIITCGMNYKELRLYDLFQYFIERFRCLKKEFNVQDLSILKKRLRYMTIFGIFEQSLTGILFAYVVLCGYIGEILIGDVITYTRAMISSRGQIQSVIQKMADLNKKGMFIEQLFEFLCLEECRKVGTTKIEEIKYIDVINLSYKYQQGSNYVLDKINLHIEKGDFIAIVGRNGSGKSTLMKILLGLYDDYEGEIFVNGIDLREIDIDEYMKHVGALFQDFSKYEGTIRENVCYSNLEMFELDETIINVCNRFGLSHLLLAQMDGIDSQLGYWFDSGKQISFGQWQKIALARTFIRNADLYFLDEPNAALDAISESEMAELYEEIFKGKIGVVIVHKFNHFINNANKIIVLKDGKIESCGSHQELIKKSKEYEHLFSSQE